MRRRRERETPEFAAMVRRMIRAHGRRCADADPEDLAELVDIARSFDEAITEAVAGLRANEFSWGQIAGPLGITRQAAQQRYGAPVAELHAQAMLRAVEARRLLVAACPSAVGLSTVPAVANG